MNPLSKVMWVAPPPFPPPPKCDYISPTFDEANNRYHVYVTDGQFQRGESASHLLGTQPSDFNWKSAPTQSTCQVDGRTIFRDTRAQALPVPRSSSAPRVQPRAPGLYADAEAPQKRVGDASSEDTNGSCCHGGREGIGRRSSDNGAYASLMQISSQASQLSEQVNSLTARMDNVEAKCGAHCVRAVTLNAKRKHHNVAKMK